MRRQRGIFLLLLAAAGAGLILSGAPEALAHAEFFHVERVEVEGERNLPEEEVRRIAAVSPSATVWADTEAVVHRLEAHPVVLDARVRRRIPSTLRIEIRERAPVALAAAPVLTPVDEEGRRLPLDPAALRLDLPILVVDEEAARDPDEEPSAGGSSTTLRGLAAEAVRIQELDPDLFAKVSELRPEGSDGVVVRLVEPPVELLYHPPLRPSRLQEGLLVLTDALDRGDGGGPAVVDLRFADQVVVEFTRGTGR